MADFHQNGIITTLHNLTHRHLADLEQDLVHFSQQRPMGLLLPSLFSELQGEALPAIVQQLKTVPYLSEIVIGLDRASADEYKHALSFFADLPQHHRIMWHDGPRLSAIDAELQALNLAPHQAGKGRNVWYCMGYILASGKAESIALHDCDITTYSTELLARLIYPCQSHV
jgi:glucosyl-3-phosphoglycerate synthase